MGGSAMEDLDMTRLAHQTIFMYAGAHDSWWQVVHDS